jgi:hypothetical protein
VHQYALWCDERRFSPSDAVPLPPALLQNAREAFGAAPPRPSLLQDEVGDALEQLGLAVQREVTVDEGYSVDLVVDYEGVRRWTGLDLTRLDSTRLDSTWLGLTCY